MQTLERRPVAAGGDLHPAAGGSHRRVAAITPARLCAAGIALVALHAADALIEKPGDRPAAVEAALLAGVVVAAAAAVRTVLAARTGSTTRGLLALLTGTGAVIEGMGVAAAHIVRDGPAGPDFTGILSAAAGLALLPTGIALLTRRLHRWWRLLAVPATGMLLLYVVTPMTLAVIATHPPAKSVEARTPAAAGLAHRDVRITTADGATLAGWYVAAAADPRIGAVVSEGGSNRTVNDIGPVAADEWLMMPAYWVVTRATGLLWPAPPPQRLEDAVAQMAPRPVLFIAASEQPELTLVRHLHDTALATTQLWEPANTAHTQGLATHPGEWTQRVLGFLDGALR